MNDTIIQDTIQMAHQVISQTKEIHHSTNWWMWLAIAEFGVLTYLLIRFVQKRDVFLFPIYISSLMKPKEWLLHI